MAVVLGTSAGFVSTAPSADPGGGGLANSDDAFATKHTSPTGSYQVSELGFYQARSNNAQANYELALYSNDATGDSSPNVVVGGIQSGSFVPASSEGWYKYSGLSIALTSATPYWVAVWGEDVSQDLYVDYTAGDLRALQTNSGGLPDPWVGGTAVDGIYAVYALYEAAAGGIERDIAGSLPAMAGVLIRKHSAKRIMQGVI